MHIRIYRHVIYYILVVVIYMQIISIILYQKIHANLKAVIRQSVKGEALSAPKRERQSRKEIKRGGGSHHCSGIFQLQSTEVATSRRTTWLPRWPVWDGNPVLSRTRKSLAQKGLPSQIDCEQIRSRINQQLLEQEVFRLDQALASVSLRPVCALMCICEWFLFVFLCSQVQCSYIRT